MATRKAAQANDTDETTSESIFIDSNDLPLALQIQAELEKYDATEEIYFKVLRTVPGKHVSNARFVANLARDDFSEERLQQPPFNGGDFRVWICGKNGMKRNFALSVEPLPESEKTATPSNDNDKTMMAFTALSQTMLQGFQQLQSVLARAPAAPQGMGVQDAIGLITALGGLKSPTPAPVAPAVDPIAMFTQFITLQKALKEDAPITTPDGQLDPMAAVVGLAREYAPVIRDMVQKRGATVPAQAPQPAFVPQQTAMPAAPALPAVTMQPQFAMQSAANPPEDEYQETDEEMSFQVRMMMPVFILAAQQKADVKQYVDILLNTVSDNVLQKYIDAPDWFEQLCGLDASVTNHKEWFTTLRDAIINELPSAQDGGTTPGT